MAKDNGFSITNVKAVLNETVDVNSPLPQEIPLVEFKRVVARVTGKIHPIVLGQFVKGMSEIGAIRADVHVATLLMHPEDI